MSLLSVYLRKRRQKREHAKLRRNFDRRHDLRYNLAPYVAANRFEIGDYSYGNPVIRMMWSDARLIVGKYCSLAEGAKFVLGGNHHIEHVTTFPLSRATDVSTVVEGPFSRGDIVVQSDVWIGSDATILSGVTVGYGAVVGACAVVAKNVPPYAIVVGNPAQVKRLRFSDRVIADLLELSWWDLPDETVRRLQPLLQSSDVAKLIAACRDLRMAGDRQTV